MKEGMIDVFRLQTTIGASSAAIDSSFAYIIMVGSTFTQALQAKILIFAGRFRCQSFLQSSLLGSPEEHSPFSAESIMLWAM